MVAPGPRTDSDATRAASRQRLLDSARSLFAERGYFACRVADVSRRAGMSPGNVYWLFESKEAILQAILAEGLVAREAMASASASEYGPARRKLEILVDRTIAFYREQEDFLRILIGLAGSGGQELIASLGFELGDLNRRHRASVRQVLAEARSEGAIVTTDPDALATVYLAFMDGLLATHSGAWRELPHEALRDGALRLLGYRPAG